jgi:hypothetical protein
MLFLSQPVGTGFSYADIQNGSFANWSGTFLNTSYPGYHTPSGTYPILDPIDEGTIDTSDLAAIAAWHTLQAFLEGLPSLEGNRADCPRNFNLWTESYGGHYGPSFFSYFQEQNALIENGTVPGYQLNFNTLGIINGIIDEFIQAPYYLEFAVNNTYGIKAYNDTIYNYGQFALNKIDGCLASIAYCAYAAADLQGGNTYEVSIGASQNDAVAAICSAGQVLCRAGVEYLYYDYGDRGTYDIRHPR